MQVLTFTLGNELFAISIDLVDTIENLTQYTIVPKARKMLIGLISIRGRVIPVLNARMLLNRVADEHEFKKLIITKLNHDKLAIAVDDIEDVIEIDENDIEQIGEDESISVVKINSELVTLLNKKKLERI